MNNPKGIAYAALSSSTFGLAPLFTVTLLRDGFSPFEVLTYRWGVASAALLLSYWLDRRYIRFDTRAPLWGQVLKLVLGLAIVVGIRVVLKAPLYALLGEGGVADAARYFLVVLFAAAIWPMTFRFFSKAARAQRV